MRTMDEINVDVWFETARGRKLTIVTHPEVREIVIFNVNALDRGFLWVKASGLWACEPVDAPARAIQAKDALDLLDRLMSLAPVIE